MLRYLFLLSLICSLNAFADIILSSPKIKLNAQNQRVIEFRIDNESINDGDVVLNEYKTNNKIDESFLAYTLINNYGNYQTFSIILDDEYIEDYFSFKILIKENFAKDIFIFLPSKIRNTFSNSKPYKSQRNLSEIKKENVALNKPEQLESEIQKIDIFKSSDITTVWSMAEKIKREYKNVSIYQIMWSIYLGNREAFIDDNINLIRKDTDVLIPSIDEIENISFQIAKESILDMNKSYASSIQSASKSLLVLTAPKVTEEVKDKKETDIRNEDKNQIDFDDLDPQTLIEQNTKQIRLDVENEILDELIEESKQPITEVDNKFQTFDLIFISLISLASGVLLALIFIQIKNIRSAKEIQYDFEEASDDKSTLTTLPSDLSIKNDIDQQQFDLAVTYYEMSDRENAEALLKNLIQTSKNSEINKASLDLLEKVKQL